MAFDSIKNSFYVFKANSTFKNGNTSETLEWLKKAYETHKSKPNIVSTYAYLLLKSGNLEESTRIFKEQLAKMDLKRDDKYQIKSNFALAQWKGNDLNGAIETLEEIFPYFRNTNIYGSYGYLLNLSGDLEKALKINLEAYDYNSTNQIIIDNLGQTYYMIGNYEKADEIYKKLHEKIPTFPEAFYDYALVLVELGQKENACEYMKKALDCKFSFLSAITKDQVQEKITELETELCK